MGLILRLWLLQQQKEKELNQNDSGCNSLLQWLQSYLFTCNYKRKHFAELFIITFLELNVSSKKSSTIADQCVKPIEESLNSQRIFLDKIVRESSLLVVSVAHNTRHLRRPEPLTQGMLCFMNTKLFFP